jgi:ribosomal protein S18 acetylase RimI-like enzyme
MIIRPLSVQDAEKMRELRLLGLQTDPYAFGSAYETEVKKPMEFFESRCEETGDKVFFGVFVQGSLKGMGSIRREQAPKYRHHAEINAVYVHPDFRGRGVSQLILKNCIDRARSWDGVEYIQLGVSTINEPAIHIYTKAGFSIWGTMKSALKIDGKDIDEHMMCLSLKHAESNHNNPPR